jgi:dsDNA-specific endonuclease/ATPase MutS2
MKEDEIIQYPVEDSLDLHTFRPNEVKDLLNDYLEAANEKGFEEVRIIHGKGMGVLRRIVHAVLEGHPMVISFKEAGPAAGGWGATIAVLRKDRL